MDFSNILSTIIMNFTKLLPFRVVMIYSYQQGVKFKMGSVYNRCNHRTGMRFYYPTLQLWMRCVPYIKIKKTRKTGIHFYWAWFEDIMIASIREKIIETQFQTVSSKDMKEVTYSVACAYHIFNAERYYTKVDEFDYSLENLIQSYLTEVMAKTNHESITKNPRFLQRRMLAEVNSSISDWGVKVTRCILVNNTKGRVIRLIQ